MLITKIKRKKDRLTICWQDEHGQDLTESTLSSFERPEPEFLSAFESLVNDVVTFLALPTWYDEGMRISGVSLSRSEDGNYGGVITALKDIEASTAPLVLNTPHVSDFEGDTLDHIGELVHRAERFICGHRSQQRLFGDEDPMAPPPAELHEQGTQESVTF